MDVTGVQALGRQLAWSRTGPVIADLVATAVRHGKGHVAAGEVSGEVGDNRDYLGLPGNSKSSFSGPGTLAYDATGAETKGASSERVSSLKVGPQVRIRLPPAESRERTCLLRGIGRIHKGRPGANSEARRQRSPEPRRCLEQFSGKLHSMRRF